VWRRRGAFVSRDDGDKWLAAVLWRAVMVAVPWPGMDVSIGRAWRARCTRVRRRSFVWQTRT